MKFERGYAQHVGSRNEQQDAGLLLADEARAAQLVLVADGMGGHAGGSLASAKVAETARRIWAEHQKKPIEPKRLLERIIREGHEAINRAGAERGLTPRSTCALLYVRNGTAHWAHVGDSRIYRLREGQLTRLTRDHSVVQMLVDLGKVSEEEMGTHPDQNRLTQSLGGDVQPMPDFGNDVVKTHDAFLICSDGLWEMIPQSEMAAALAARKLGDDGAKHLAERAYDRAKPRSDNITVALLRVGGPPPSALGDALDDAKTTRRAEPKRAGAGGGARWGFVAATLVALGAAGALVYKPWDKQGMESEQAPVVAPKGPDESVTPPVQERPEQPKPGDPQGEAPPRPPPQRAPDKPPSGDPTPTPGAAPPQPAPPGPSQPAPSQPGDQGGTQPEKTEPPSSGGEPDRNEARPKPAGPPAAQPENAPPGQSGLGPADKGTEPPANTDKPADSPPPAETKPQ